MPRTQKTTDTQVVLTTSQYDTLVARLDELSKGMNDLKLDIASRQHIDEEVKSHKELLTGNGKWGFSKLRDWAMSADEENRFYKRFVITMTATNIVSLIVAAFFWFIKVLPVLDKLQQAGL